MVPRNHPQFGFPSYVYRKYVSVYLIISSCDRYVNITLYFHGAPQCSNVAGQYVFYVSGANVRWPHDISSFSAKRLHNCLKYAVFIALHVATDVALFPNVHTCLRVPPYCHF